MISTELAVAVIVLFYYFYLLWSSWVCWEAEGLKPQEKGHYSRISCPDESIQSVCTANLLWARGSSYFCVTPFGWSSIHCDWAFLVIWRQWKIRDKRCRVGEEDFVPVLGFFLSPCLWSRNICWEPQTAEFSNTTSRCQATLPSSGTFTAEEINQSGNKEWGKFRKKCQKPNLSRVKWIRTLLVFGEANWNVFLTHVSPQCHCCLRNSVITKLWAKDTQSWWGQTSGKLATIS